ncbi:SDR family NAD(P)-dependent oxidoreductase [Pelagicoccus sp. SDUM812002]|uniref:SDR family NAD(P)-dependent oxidoreductase n=1 Tax=Pelagicoccus sp. SDUM812002 TaxID=3041266 RepID=UPI00280D9814|nr:SDR family NAD(P)-dependent oxidoreductase [Pelagicoccus sp. SDUM812002]MDQ8188550.1 SDR family NAD(P)-dependent oxidoreductase [Pelagicoccus sp. SDUM812002]
MKQVLITGCTRGLGYHLLKTYLNDGWTVFPLVRDLERISEIIKENRETCFPIHSDLTNSKIKTTIQNELEKNKASLTVVINNAGTGGGHESSIKDIELDFLSSMISTHCTGALAVVQASLPFLQKGKSTIVNVSSRLGSAQKNGNKEFSGLGFSYSYRISKASQNMATLCMSQDSELDGITVCAIHPGRLKTDSGAFDADTDPATAAQKMKRKIETLSHKDNGTYIDLENGLIPW